MVDRDDHNKNPESNLSQSELHILYGRLFGVAFRHPNAAVDEHIEDEGEWELHPALKNTVDNVAHSYRVAFSRQQLELCDIDGIDAVEIIQSDPRMLDDEPADGMGLILIYRSGIEEAYSVTYDPSKESGYEIDHQVRHIREGGDLDSATLDSDISIDEAVARLELDQVAVTEADIVSLKSLLRHIETGYGL